jgi:hypothetical protein
MNEMVNAFADRIEVSTEDEQTPWGVIPAGTPYRDARTAWERLIEHFAEGQRLCNCRQAYYTSGGYCAAGCQSNCYSVREYIAKRVIAALATEPQYPESDPLSVASETVPAPR